MPSAEENKHTNKQNKLHLHLLAEKKVNYPLSSPFKKSKNIELKLIFLSFLHCSSALAGRLENTEPSSPTCTLYHNRKDTTGFNPLSLKMLRTHLSCSLDCFQVLLKLGHDYLSLCF